MKQPLNIKDLVNLLYQNKELVEMLFGNKDSIRRAEILSRTDIDEERLEKLIAHSIVHENNYIISLDDRIFTFIEEFLEIGEVTTSFINDNIESLNENLKYYRIDSNSRFLRNIKRALSKINSTTSREVIKLHKNIDDTYKNQSNYNIKIQELEKYKSKRDDIIDLILQTEKILSENQGFFNTVLDAELNSILLEVKHTLLRNRDYLNEIQAQIIDYINKIQFQSEIYKKIQRLKELKDYEELKYKTDFIEVVSSQRALFLNKKPMYRTRVSLEFLFSDEGHSITARVARKLRLLSLDERKPAGKFSEDAEITSSEKALRINIPSLFAKFTNSGKDLFDFLMSYEFPADLGEIHQNKRISLYVELAIDFDAQLSFSVDMGRFAYVNQKLQKQKISYAIIYPINTEINGTTVAKTNRRNLHHIKQK